KFKVFSETYDKMKETEKWILSTGTCVEDAIYDYCINLNEEILLHSWVIDLEDTDAEKLFTEPEWTEIKNSIQVLPKVDEDFAKYLQRFSNIKSSEELRNFLETTSYKSNEIPYDRETHYDFEWVELVMKKFLTEYEDNNKPLQRSHLEGWYDVNIWSLIVDHGLKNIHDLEIVRKESNCKSSSVKINQSRSKKRHKKMTRKRIGPKLDGVFRMYGEMEYGAIEVGKDFDQTKLLSDNFKLEKVLKDMHVQLCQKNNSRKLRVPGILHLGLKMQSMHLSNPKGYISIIKRENIHEVPSSVERLKDMLKLLANIWLVKAIILECITIVNARNDNSGFLREIINIGNQGETRGIIPPWS
ncbi:16653_t:CDS:2, partial [Dentiscutata erythropus]